MLRGLLRHARGEGCRKYAAVGRCKGQGAGSRCVCGDRRVFERQGARARVCALFFC